MSTISTQRRETPNFPYTDSPEADSVPGYGRVLVDDHTYKYGRLTDRFGYWNWERGRVNAEALWLDGRAESEEFEAVVIGSGLNRVRFRFEPEDDFTDGMVAVFKITHRSELTMVATVSGDAEAGALTLDAKADLEAKIFDEKLAYEVAVGVSGADVTIKRTATTSLRAKGAGTFSHSLNGNGTASVKDGAGASVSATDQRELSGEAEIKREVNEIRELTRKGAKDTIDRESIIQVVEKEFRFTRARLKSDWFTVSSTASVTATSGSDQGASKAELTLETDWTPELTIETADGEQVALLLDPLPPGMAAIIDRKEAILALYQKGVPLAVAARAADVDSYEEFRELMAVETPSGYRPNPNRVQTLLGFWG